MVFDRPVLLRRSAAANVAYALAVHGIGNPERRRRVEESLESTGLARFADRPARTLSAGEKQRLALARAWALRSEEHTSELQSLMRISFAVFCLQKKKKHIH